jgi:tRNA dimethylallyltransferase
MIACLEGKLTLAEALSQTQQGTRRYAKRQLTWFRKDKEIGWVDQFGNSPEAAKIITTTVGGWLADLGFSLPLH